MQTSNQLTQSLVGASFTSTTAAVATDNSIKELSDLERRMEYMQLIKSRQDVSQVIIVTDQGRMTFEIYCGKSPNMAEKFIELALTKFFNDLQFENLGSYLRTVPMAEKSPDAYYDNDSFKDTNTEKSLTHSQRGLLSMSSKDP